jgi:hypothetical protein
MDAVETLRRAAKSYASYLQPSGELHDPVFGEPTQYGTPYHALCNAALAKLNGPGSPYAERALRGLKASLDHVSDPELPANASGFDRATGSVSRANHRDFFWPPILKAFLVLKEMDLPGMDEIGDHIRGVDIESSFRSRPPSNWAAVWLSGEWLRLREGLSPHSMDRIDDWLGAFFEEHVLTDRGLYQEPGHPNSYDLFTRYHLADMLAEGYEGRWRAELELLMETGLRRSLDVQLSDGSLASAHRSTGQTWTLGAQCAYFTYAANHFRDRDPELSRLASSAARRALSSFRRWQRPDGPYSPVENLLPPGYRVGYEAYTADGHYANLAAAFLAIAVLNGLDSSEPERDRPLSARIEHDPTYRAVLHNGPYSLHFNARPAPAYDGFGITDLTFGPGRFLQFVSSARHQQSGKFFNLGVASRAHPGLSELKVVAQGDYALVGEMERREGPASLMLEARDRGNPYRYRFAARIEADGVHVEEETPGSRDYKTLLVPYPGDVGNGVVTEARAEAGRARLVHGDEEIEVSFGAPVERVIHLPHGYENRRGLCGLLRIDFRGPAEGISYRVRVVR